MVSPQPSEPVENILQTLRDSCAENSRVCPKAVFRASREELAIISTALAGLLNNFHMLLLVSARIWCGCRMRIDQASILNSFA